MTDFPVYEIVDSADNTTPTIDPSNKRGNDPRIIRSSSRNVGPPNFYGKRFFIDVVDLPQATSGSASNPIVVENGEPTNRTLTTVKLLWNSRQLIPIPHLPNKSLPPQLTNP